MQIKTWMKKTVYANKERVLGFQKAMEVIQKEKFGNIAKNLSQVVKKEEGTFLDIGGGLGVLCVQIKKVHPKFKCINLDIKSVEEFALQYVKEKCEGEVEIVSGDMFNAEESFPTADVIALGNILHSWSEEKKINLLKKCKASLNEGGALLVVEDFIDNEREKDSNGLTMSVAMAAFCGGNNSSFNDIEKLGLDAGFSKVVDMTKELNAEVIVLFK